MHRMRTRVKTARRVRGKKLPGRKAGVLLPPPVPPLIEAGISGFVPGGASVRDFLETIRSVATGARVLPSPAASTAAGTAGAGGPVTLTPAERDLVAMIGAGRSRGQIMRKLGITPGTLDQRMHRILQRTFPSIVRRVGRGGKTPPQKD